MYVHELNPIFLQIGFLEIRWYGVLYALGFLFIYFYLSFIAKRKEIPHFNKEDVDTFVTGLIIFVILGARLFHVFVYYPVYYLSNPIEILQIWRGGLSFHGALLFSSLWIWYYCKRKNIMFFQLTDVLVLPLAFFLALGRMANFINGELVGKLTNVSWAVDFSNVNSQYEGFRHPTQIYESFKNLFLFLGLVLLTYLRNVVFRKYIPGLLTIIFLIGYGLFRFFIEFLKEGVVVAIGLNMGQILSVALVLISIYIGFMLIKTKKDFEKHSSSKKNKKKK